MQRELWKTEPNGVLSAEAGNFRLIVQAPEQVGGIVRFQVLRQEIKGSLEILVGSGNEADIITAMTAAEQMADRCTELGLYQTIPIS